MQNAPKQFWTALIWALAAGSAYLIFLIPDAYLSPDIKKVAIGAAIGAGLTLPITPPGVVNSDATQNQKKP